jgi:hypothetical protein
MTKLFIEHSKYRKIYLQIINRAKSEQRKKHRQTHPNYVYYEKHHIFPSALFPRYAKLSLHKWNGVLLTAREHFICHWLLSRMLPDSETMNYALWMLMTVKNKHTAIRYKVNSHTYQLLKTRLAITFSKQHIGRKMSEETKRKISETRKRKIREGTLKVNENKEKYKKMSENMKGRDVSEETRKKIGDAHRGKTISVEQRAILSEKNTGKKHTKETREKISNIQREQYASGERINGMKGKVPWNKGIKWKRKIDRDS